VRVVWRCTLTPCVCVCAYSMALHPRVGFWARVGIRSHVEKPKRRGLMAAPWDRPGSATSSRQQHAHTMTRLVGPRQPVAGPIGRTAVAVALATGIIFPPVVPRNPGPTRPFKVRSTLAMCCGMAGCTVLREWLAVVQCACTINAVGLVGDAVDKHDAWASGRYQVPKPGASRLHKRHLINNGKSCRHAVFLKKGVTQNQSGFHES